jgi:hypothetical protein
MKSITLPQSMVDAFTVTYNHLSRCSKSKDKFAGFGDSAALLTYKLPAGSCLRLCS